MQFHKEEIYKWRFERTILFEVQTKKNLKNIKRRMNKRMKQKEEESHRFIHHFITSKIFTLSTILQFWKSENYLKRRSKTQEKSNKNTFRRFIKTGEVLKNSRKMKKEERKFHNLCQPISNWKLIKWRQRPGKIGYFKLTTGNNL